MKNEAKQQAERLLSSPQTSDDPVGVLEQFIVLTRLDASSSTPGDEVAQRVRAAAEEIVASVSVNDFRNIQSFNRYDRLTDVILKHLTATDVEQGTCTEHEK